MAITGDFEAYLTDKWYGGYGESLAGMAVNKPPRGWVDPDIDRATVELAEMAQRFVRAESFARVKGRQDKRHAMVVVVGMEGPPAPLHAEFDVADIDRSEVRSLIERMDTTLRESGEARSNIILAAPGRIERPLFGDHSCCGATGHLEEEAVTARRSPFTCARTIPNLISTISSPIPVRNYRRSTSSWLSSKGFWANPS